MNRHADLQVTLAIAWQDFSWSSCSSGQIAKKHTKTMT